MGVFRVITVGPAGTETTTQVPPGAGPAGTITGIPATLKLKFVPRVTPLPAILQTLTKPVELEFVNVTSVIEPPVIVTVAVPTARLELTSAPAGNVVTDANTADDGSVSVIVTGPMGRGIGALHAPTPTPTAVPATLKVKIVPGGRFVLTLQI
jgi:hypothetical protein